MRAKNHFHDASMGAAKKMKTKTREIESVQRHAIKAWHATEIRHREALLTVVRTRREMAELERIISGPKEAA
jgi:hypothetical protein